MSINNWALGIYLVSIIEIPDEFDLLGVGKKQSKQTKQTKQTTWLNMISMLHAS